MYCICHCVEKRTKINMKGPGLAHLKKHQSRLRQTSKSFSLELPRAQLIKIFLFDYKRRRPKHGKEELFSTTTVTTTTSSSKKSYLLYNRNGRHSKSWIKMEIRSRRKNCQFFARKIFFDGQEDDDVLRGING